MSEMNIPTKESVEKVIKESSSLVQALESVAAMYQIPAENIIVDDRAKSIRVTGDSIVTPDRPNPSANTKAIVCAIGAVLDNISQRIDQKLNTYQNDQIAQNRLTANQKTPDPSKGEVVGRFTDANGDEIIAYSSGLVDSNNTPEANAKVKELRDSKQIPDFVSEPSKPNNSSYFTDEDDIMNGVDTTTNDKIKFDIDKHQRDIASQIHESAHFMDLIDHYNGTTTLGYDMLREQGFDYVEATHAMIQEAVSKSHPPSSADLKHMKFDNTNLMKAMNLFNVARTEIQSETPTLKELCRNDKFKEAIKYVEKQFDCHLVIRFFDVKDNNGNEVTDGYTSTYNDINQPISVSKSKGFQLHGTPINIDLAGKILQINPAHKEQGLFGQTVLAIILHEIWHNISCSLRKENDAFIFTITSSVMMATSTTNMKNRRIIISNCVNTLSELSKKKISRLEKRKLVKQLLAIVSNKADMQELEKLRATAETSSDMADLDEYMRKMEEYVKKHKPAEKRGKATKLRKFTGGLLTVVGFICACTIALLPVGLILITIGDSIGGTVNGVNNKKLEEWLKTTNKEEYYADLFSSMYGLPNVFGLGPALKGYTANAIDKERLQKLTDLEREIGQLVFDPHPSAEERSFASVKVAKRMLASGEKIDPAVKKYCEWIIANYSSLEDTNLSEVYASNIFDPKEAEDLDKHLQNIVDNNNITVTESVKIK